MKHAFLILAHTDFDVLLRLLACLDDTRNDIYLHFDRKVKEMPTCRTKNATLNILNHRIDVRWGDFSMVKAEMLLFQTAYHHGPYQYYHLLSGVDLPLKSQDYIHQFFDDNNGKEFIGYTNIEMTRDLLFRMRRWHLFPRSFRGSSDLVYHLRSLGIRFQRAMNIQRNGGVSFKKGPQWVSVTNSMVQLLLSKERWINRTFTHSFCSDESLFQTICWDSPLRDHLYCADTKQNQKGCMRKIGWRNGVLQDWGPDDYDELISSPALFARKFNSKDPVFLNDVLLLSQNVPGNILD